MECAGTWTVSGLPPAPLAVQAARRHGLSIEKYTTRSITAGVLSEYDLILVMEAGQKEALEIEFPEVRNRVFLLSAIVNGIIYDIPDPFKSEENSPQEIASELCNLVSEGFQNIFLEAERLSWQRNSISGTE